MAGYIGNAPINNSIFKQIFTPSTGTTTFTPGTAYTPGFIDVYQNGIKLIDTTDYTASNGTTVVLGVAATTGDTIEIVTYETFQTSGVNATTFVGSSEDVAGDGSGTDAVSTGTLITNLSTSGGTSALTLAAGTDGQVKIIIMEVAGNAATMTAAAGNLQVSTSVVWDAVGEAATLVYSATLSKWIVVSVQGATVS